VIRTVGIDPGLTGAIVCLDPEARIVAIADMPSLDGKVSGSLLADILREAHVRPDETTVVVENVHTMPGQGVASGFKFGRTVGVIDGVTGALGLPTVYVSPQVWKRKMGLSSDKKACRGRAIDMWPSWRAWFGRAKDDGRAEAALIAYHHHVTHN